MLDPARCTYLQNGRPYRSCKQRGLRVLDDLLVASQPHNQRLARFPALDQFDAEESTQATHVAHDGVYAKDGRQSLLQST